MSIFFGKNYCDSQSQPNQPDSRRLRRLVMRRLWVVQFAAKVGVVVAVGWVHG